MVVRRNAQTRPRSRRATRSCDCAGTRTQTPGATQHRPHSLRTQGMAAAGTVVGLEALDCATLDSGASASLPPVVRLARQRRARRLATAYRPIKNTKSFGSFPVLGVFQNCRKTVSQLTNYSARAKGHSSRRRRPRLQSGQIQAGVSEPEPSGPVEEVRYFLLVRTSARSHSVRPAPSAALRLQEPMTSRPTIGTEIPQWPRPSQAIERASGTRKRRGCY